MHPFPEEDELKIGQGHALPQLLIFGDLLIKAKCLHPLVMGKRRYGAGNRLPLRYRQARFGEPGDAAHHDHAENQRGYREQPAGDGKWAGCSHGRAKGKFGHGADPCADARIVARGRPLDKRSQRPVTSGYKSPHRRIPSMHFLTEDNR